MNANVAHEVRLKCKNAIEVILSKCDDFITLEKLLTPSTPIDIVVYILDKMSKVFLFIIHT